MINSISTAPEATSIGQRSLPVKPGAHACNRAANGAVAVKYPQTIGKARRDHVLASTFKASKGGAA